VKSITLEFELLFLSYWHSDLHKSHHHFAGCVAQHLFRIHRCSWPMKQHMKQNINLQN